MSAVNHAATVVVTDVTASITASQNAGRELRRASRTPRLDPIAMPVMNAAAMVANAYVVGPRTSAISRVHATSYTRAANPESAAAQRRVRAVARWLSDSAACFDGHDCTYCRPSDRHIATLAVRSADL